MPEQREQNDDRDWNAKKPEKYSASEAHCLLLERLNCPLQRANNARVPSSVGLMSHELEGTLVTQKRWMLFV
jgi:hypothetical protein